MLAIKNATEKDVSIIHELAESIWWDTYSPILTKEQIRFMLDTIYDEEILRQQITNGEQSYVLLIEDDNPTGFASYSPRKENPDIYKLHKLYCLPQRQGKGLGKALLIEVEKEVKATGKKILELNVNKYNPAKTFYEKMGFEIIYEEDIPIGPYWMNDYVMRKEL